MNRTYVLLILYIEHTFYASGNYKFVGIVITYTELVNSLEISETQSIFINVCVARCEIAE